MTRALCLEEFSTGASEPTIADEPASAWAPDVASEPEVDMLDAYDNGYKCGWADCATAEAEERRGIGADLAKNLAEATLTYDTARRDVLAALGPLFEDIVATLLPRLAAEAILPCVLAELGQLADAQTRNGIELHAAPSTCPSLERLLESEGIDCLLVHAEPAFSDGQVSLRVGSERRDIDMGAAADRIADAIAGFQAEAKQADNAKLTLSQGAV